METGSGSASLERERLWFDCVLEGDRRKETIYEEIGKKALTCRTHLSKFVRFGLWSGQN